MFAEFNWWLLIVGLVVGAGLTWLVLADARRREVDLEEADVADEAVWLERTMAERGDPIDIATAEHMLRLHRAYLGLPPPELPEPAEAADTAEPVAGADWVLAEPVEPAVRTGSVEPADPIIDRGTEPSRGESRDDLDPVARRRD